MTKSKKKKIIPQMFDVRPVAPEGDLDWKKVLKVAESAKYKFFSFKRQEYIEETKEISAKIIHWGETKLSQEVPIISQSEYQPIKSIVSQSYKKEKKEKNASRLKIADLINQKIEKIRDFSNGWWRPALATMAVSGFFLLAWHFSINAFNVKSQALQLGDKAYASLNDAKNSLQEKDFQSSVIHFQTAEKQFKEISGKINSFGKVTVEISRFLPYASKLSSGSHLAKAGEQLSKVGAEISEVLSEVESIKNFNQEGQKENISLLSLLNKFKDKAVSINDELALAEENLNKVNIEDLPSEQQEKIIQVKKTVTEAQQLVKAFLSNGQIFSEILGGNGPRKYLFLFQNNQEIRATGGFVGSYGVLDIFNGRVRNFFIDGIFNPDGQLVEKVVPPLPIQKISVAWSLHDSNWWPNFPTSAEKAMWFYEKTGGPTVDGVITMTPTVLEKLLSITGPIEMPEYDLTIDKDNFVENIQTEVEVNYDKTLNQPKKVLSDLAPKVLDKIFNVNDLESLNQITGVLSESLAEKQILFYSKNYEIEKKLSGLGWSGEVLDTDKDYLSVINTNINGYKTDGVIDEKIEHLVDIQEDGSIIDTVLVTRQHQGGKTGKEWWDKVNADYMRVYVPKGSKLLSAEGQTREFNKPPVDYDVLGFSRDSQVQMEEQNIVIDEESGTRIYNDSNKTVFANWVYVSPQETVTVKYSYLLPFKISPKNINHAADSYSLVAQKQSGSAGSQFKLTLMAPESFRSVWNYPQGLSSKNEKGKNIFELKTDLKTDKFFGVAWAEK